MTRESMKKPRLCPKLICFLWVLVCMWTPSISEADDQEEEPRLPLAMEVFLKKPKKDQYDIHIPFNQYQPGTGQGQCA